MAAVEWVSRTIECISGTIDSAAVGSASGASSGAPITGNLKQHGH
jgi:hypothetical protein